MPISKATASAIAPAAKGDLVVGSATNDAAVLGVGSADQVLTVDSSTTTGLKWATPSAGGITLLSTTTLSGTSVTLSSIPQTYNNLYLYFKNVVNTTDNAKFRIRPNNVTNTGAYVSIEKTNVQETLGSEVETNNRLLTSNNDNAFSMIIENYTEAAVWKPMLFRGRFVNSASQINPFIHGGGIYTADAITSIVLVFEDSRTFTGGTVKLYGVK